MAGKRILFISETVVIPIERGNRKRVYNLINLAREAGCTVDFLYLHTYSNEDPAATREWIGEDHFFTVENKKRSFGVFCKRKVRKVLEILHIPGLFKYFSIDEKMDPAIDGFMTGFLKEHKYDVVWIEYIFNSRPLLSVPEGVVKVIDTHNAFTFKRQMYEAVGYKNYEFALTKEEEAKGLSRADWVVAIQEEEADFFRTIVPASTKVCTIGENMPLKEAAVAPNKNILFIGSFYVVNRDGIKHFTQDILPILKKKGADFNFQIAGTICKHIPDSPDYEKLGIVDDVGDAYRNARVVINPVRHGTGLNIKTIEALSYTKPLVSHSIGVRGLRSDFPIAKVTDDDEAFADALIEILESDEKAKELSDNAERFMKEYQRKNMTAFEEILA
ncbi:MAG: glycosyltransferase family 4 protein [Lachnospiraceae bacterium]|nr:glycosyltransferase family 4 protein [Lachnospiraceae bacterium]